MSNRMLWVSWIVLILCVGALLALPLIDRLLFGGG